MRIAVIGAGKIGGTVGGKLEQAGHDVVYGLRDPSKRAGAKPIPDAIVGAEAVLLALPGAAVVDFVRANAAGLDGKILLDATNNFAAPAHNSATEIAALVPDAHIFRVFNTLGWEIFAEPIVGGTQADHLYGGPEGPAQDAVEQLIKDVGLRPIRVGGIEQFGIIDGALSLWFTLTRHYGRRIAFKLISDQPIG